MTSQRAKDLLRLQNWGNGGCLGIGNQKPDVPEMTEAERKMVREIWKTEKNGSVTINGVLGRIANGKIIVTGR